MAADELYSCLRGVNDGLQKTFANRHLDSPSKKIASLLERLDERQSVEVFRNKYQIGQAFQCVSLLLSHPDIKDGIRLGLKISHALTRSIKVKQNVTGTFDMFRRSLLIPFLKSNPTDQEKGFEALMIETLFHHSMEKQYNRYLSVHESIICLKEGMVQSFDKFPTVYAFFQVCETEWTTNSISVRWIPILISGFITRYIQHIEASNGIENDVSDKRMGFLFAAKLCSIRFGKKRTSSDQSMILDVLRLIDKHELYQPTSDDGFRHLNFLRRLIDTILKPSKSKGHSTKRQKLCWDSIESLWMIDLSRILLKIEYRVLTPHLKDIFIRLGQTERIPDASTFLIECIEVISKARKWIDFFQELIEIMETSSSFLKLIVKDDVLKEVRKASLTIPNFEIPTFLERIAHHKQRRSTIEMDSEEDFAFLTLIEAAIVSFRIDETNVLPISQSFLQILPDIEALKVTFAQHHFGVQLKLTDRIISGLKRCSELHPSIDRRIPLLLQELENLFPNASFSSIGALHWIQCLAERLELLYLQNQKAAFEASQPEIDTQEPIAHEMLRVLSFLDVDRRNRIEKAFLTTFFFPWVNSCSDEDLTSFLSSILHRSSNMDLFQHLFEDPYVYGSPKFGQCFRTVFVNRLTEASKSIGVYPSLAIVLDSAELKTKDVQKVLVQKLESNRIEFSSNPLNLGDLMDFLKFGLRLPEEIFGKDRFRLEMVVVLLSAQYEDMRILECVKYFIPRSITEGPLWMSKYVATVYFWVLKLCERQTQMASIETTFALIDEILDAVTKQLVISQWLKGNREFFGTSTDLRLIQKPWKHKSFDAGSLISTLWMKNGGVLIRERSARLASLLAFVRFCKTFQTRSRKGFICLKGPLPPTWKDKIWKQLKSLEKSPNLTLMPDFLKKTVLPIADEVLNEKSSDSNSTWTIYDLTTVSEIVIEIISFKADLWNYNHHSIVERMLTLGERQIKERRWTALPIRIETFLRILSHELLIRKFGNDVKHRVVILFFELFVKVSELSNDFPDVFQQPFLLIIPCAEIVFSDSETRLTIRRKIFHSFSSLVSNLDPTMIESVIRFLMKSLEEAPLERTFSAIQFLTLLLYENKTCWSNQSSHLPKQIFEHAYRCFWEGYFRHFLLRVVDRKQRQEIVVPDPSQTGVFSSLLCGFFRCFSLCHMAIALPQRLTIQIMRRIKRLIQGLYKHTCFATLQCGVSWFGEICEFMISAVRHQQSIEAAKVFFPSFRSALESLLSLLFVWDLDLKSQYQSHIDKAQTKLGAIYTEIANCAPFKEMLPELLLSYLYIEDTLKTCQFTKKSPLRHYFEQQPHLSTSTIRLEKLKRYISRLHAKLDPKQRRDLKSRVMTEESIVCQLDAMDRIREQFEGHDG